MQIVLDIPDNLEYLNVLRKWASVSRTLNESRRLLEVVDESGLFGDESDAININHDELGELEPALNWLHQAVRGKIWEEDERKAKASA